MTELTDHDIDGSFSTARINVRSDDILLTSDSYREFIYDHDDPAIAKFRGLDYEAFADEKKRPSFVQDLLASWQALYDEPFVGITTDGTLVPGLYPLPKRTEPNDERMVTAAYHFLATLDAPQRAAVNHAIDAPEWRAWSNPEFVIHRVGVRLEELSRDAADAALSLVAASLSPAGYERVREAMSLNGYLGELTDLTPLMNERSYWFSLFGTPSTTEPWGWQLFGHHVAVNCIVVGGRQVIAPVFLGAEPALSDGAHPPLFADREAQAIRLGESFTDAQRAKAVVYRSVLDPAMPEGRVHPADERHVAGAFRDNRVVPYEGICVREFDDAQRRLLREIVDDFLLLLPDHQRALTMQLVGAHLGDTWVSWYGATDGSQPFYLRIQSPVIIAEMDHHAGVWLSNRLPARFHVHTTLRLPNGNDYGRAYLAQWRAQRNE
ncbi:DUF3500 domain-containing protein [Microbacterium protaetiae]|uniref:DUF3500 domain-containing protein n=1 Tax=Microbacterium protaetiae TaxID=2509458 RepID=A0A4P6EPE8_9MICO|nr:DUF3500 domain-containing protein [Microbacterium protaetiae]QAY59838.1 DUF3500 domain-containing protein [Microbacterium protaetiae]